MRQTPRILIAFLIVLGLSVLWIVWTSFQNFLGNRTETQTPPSRTEVLVTEEGQELLSDALTLEPTILGDGTTVIALTGDGSLITTIDIPSANQSQKISSPIGANISFVRYAPDGTSAIVHQREDLEHQASTSLYRFSDGTTATLSPKIYDLTYSTDSQSIIYLYEVGRGVFQLVRALPDGSGWDILLDDIRIIAPSLHLSPDGNRLLITSDPTAEGDEINPDANDRTPMLVYLQTETTERIPILTGGTNIRWSPDSQHVAYYRVKADATGTMNLYTFATLTETPTTITTGNRLYNWVDNDHLIVAPITDSEIGAHPLQLSIDGTHEELTTISIGPGLHELHIAPDIQTLVLLVRGALISTPLPTSSN